MKKPHYFAICRSRDGTYFITNTVYADDETARADNPGIYVRLATEHAPLVIDTTTYKAPVPNIKPVKDDRKPWQKRKG